MKKKDQQIAQLKAELQRPLTDIPLNHGATSASSEWNHGFSAPRVFWKGAAEYFHNKVQKKGEWW